MLSDWEWWQGGWGGMERTETTVVVFTCSMLLME